jgi:phage baseplate assembly protein W
MMPKNPKPKEDRLTREYASELARFAQLERQLARVSGAWNKSRQALRRYEKRLDARQLEAAQVATRIAQDHATLSDPIPQQQ